MFLEQRWFRRWDGRIINETEVEQCFSLCSGMNRSYHPGEFACHVNHLISMGRIVEIDSPHWEDFLYAGQEITAISKYRSDNPGMPLGTAKDYIMNMKNKLALEGKI